MLVLALQTLKVGGHFRVLRGRRNTLEPCEFCDVANVFFCESQCQGSASMTHMTQCQESRQAQHFVSALKNRGSFAKFILFELCKNSFKKNSHKTVDFESQKCQNWRCCREVLWGSVVEMRFRDVLWGSVVKECRGEVS